MKTIAFLPVLLFAACASTAPAFTIQEREPRRENPDAFPAPLEGDARLVDYPGSDVSYVANVPDEVYEYGGVYYCFLRGHWFRAYELKGPWIFTEMKDVPADLFRVRGHLPPGVTR